MSSTRLRRLVAVSTFAVAIPLAIGAPAFAATDAPTAGAQQPTAQHPVAADQGVVFQASADGPTEKSAVRAATNKVEEAFKAYAEGQGKACVTTGPAVVVTAVNPHWWHAEASLTAYCSD